MIDHRTILLGRFDCLSFFPLPHWIVDFTWKIIKSNKTERKIVLNLLFISTLGRCSVLDIFEKYSIASGGRSSRSYRIASFRSDFASCGKQKWCIGSVQWIDRAKRAVQCGAGCSWEQGVAMFLWGRGVSGGIPCGVMLETRSARAADSVWASKPLPAPHAMANSRHGKAQVGVHTLNFHKARNNIAKRRSQSSRSWLLLTSISKDSWPWT